MTPRENMMARNKLISRGPTAVRVSVEGAVARARAFARQSLHGDRRAALSIVLDEAERHLGDVELGLAALAACEDMVRSALAFAQRAPAPAVSVPPPRVADVAVPAPVPPAPVARAADSIAFVTDSFESSNGFIFEVCRD